MQNISILLLPLKQSKFRIKLLRSIILLNTLVFISSHLFATVPNTTVPGGVTLCNILAFPATSSNAFGVVYINAIPFMHSFGTNNTFLGPNSGNFTLSSSNSVGIGANALTALTTGGGC